jgi:molybdenum-dependent DNA-binding transcriptional regulator ModE
MRPGLPRPKPPATTLGPVAAETERSDGGWTAIEGAQDPTDVLEIHEVGHLHELSHPVRSRIMRAMKHPRTVAEAAELLDVPVTRLYHHVNRLESLGFIRVVATRRVGAATERRYQVTAAAFEVGPDLFASSDPHELALALGSVFETSKMTFQREVEHGSLSSGPVADKAIVTRASLTLTEDRRLELIRRLEEILEEFAADDDRDAADADATPRTEMFVAVFPDTL